MEFWLATLRLRPANQALPGLADGRGGAEWQGGGGGGGAVVAGEGRRGEARDVLSLGRDLRDLVGDREGAVDVARARDGEAVRAFDRAALPELAQVAGLVVAADPNRPDPPGRGIAGSASALALHADEQRAAVALENDPRGAELGSVEPGVVEPDPRGP